ncbi:hypothetical protein [Persicirhabdus sediminis]|uniref:Uncharacterized protein n=1 Tax=Persicirhabdus sediminis TaxID=454144 RepID=A0A8J7MDY2_9BACT|nr:hypothetical protein [Persicirhabdus sediminis]MBK1791642.1 hypothetical protein [Persicirhabdus sediminis]
MKAIIYGVVTAAALGGAYVSYQQKTEFEASIEELAGVNQNIEVQLGNNRNKEKEVEAAKADYDTKNNTLLDANGDLEVANKDLQAETRSMQAIERKVASVQTELDKQIESVKQIKELFGAENVELDEVGGFITDLENEVTNNTVKLEDTQLLVDGAQKAVDSNNEGIASVKKRLADRSARIASNSKSGLVTAVNNDWGFAVVNVPTDMPINTSTKLMVRRGSDLIGRLKISAIEGSRLVTDIDYKSMKPGVLIQPGDQVILQKPVAN